MSDWSPGQKLPLNPGEKLVLAAAVGKIRIAHEGGGDVWVGSFHLYQGDRIVADANNLLIQVGSAWCTLEVWFATK